MPKTRTIHTHVNCEEIIHELNVSEYKQFQCQILIILAAAQAQTNGK